MSQIEVPQNTSYASKAPHVQTSLVEVTNHLPEKPPCRIFFKNEYEQPCGSFKLRGIGHLISKQIQEAQRKYPTKKIHVFASSGGNAGLAAAYLARFYRVGCTVVLPVISQAEVIAKLHSYNASTIKFGCNINEADKHLRGLIKNIDSGIHPIYCHPFDNSLIWDGHASMIDEIYQHQLSRADAEKVRGVVCSVGGGGLYNGIVKGLDKNAKSQAEVLLMETDQAPTLLETVKAGKIITLKSVKSLATSLACSYLSSQSLDNIYNSRFKTHVDSIDDLEAIRGLIEFYHNSGVVVEPACGAALSVVYNQMHLLTKHLTNLSPEDIVIIVVCGGSCTTKEGVENFERMLNSKCKL